MFGRSRTGSARKPSLRNALTVLLEKDGKVLFELTVSSLPKPIVIGRGVDCDWSVAGLDPSMSGRHAELFIRHGSLRIRDLGSRNGLYFHGQRVEEHRLQPGDEILIGACSLTAERAKTASSEDEAPRYNRLEQLNGPDAGRVVNLVGPADVVIGSDPGSSVICADTLVSHRHAVIAFKPDGSCWVSDLGSRNGSAVNDVPLKKERMLRDGDVLKIAYLEFRFFDKNVVHAHAHVGRTIAIAAVTLAVVLTGYFIWSSATPSARDFVAQAQAAAERGDFNEAFACLDQAAVAKHGQTIYRPIIREQRERTVVWTNAIANWKFVKESLAAKRWFDAVGRFTELTPWESAFGWNMNSAVRERNEAMRVKALLDGFLGGYQLLQVEEWNEEVPARFRDACGELDAALSDAKSVIATNGYCGPLFAISEDILDELRATAGDFDGIERNMAALNGMKVEVGKRPAGAALAGLGKLRAAYEARGEKRALQQIKAKLKSPRFSRIPGIRFKAACDLVDALCSAELEMEENLDKIAREEYAGVTRELPLPTVESCGKFGLSEYRLGLQEANALVCGPVLEGLKTQMGMLKDHDFKFETGEVNAAFGSLIAPGTIGEVLRFVPDGTKPISSKNPVCRYDEVVGVVAFNVFLRDLAKIRPVKQEDESLRLEQEDVARCVDKYFLEVPGQQWAPLLCQVRDECEVLASFESTVENDPTGLSRKIRNRELPDGGNRVGRAAAFVHDKRAAFEEWLDDFCDACDKDGSPRARILGDGVEMLMKNPENPSVTAADALRKSWAKLRESVPLDINGTADEWRAIMREDLPGRGTFSAAWKHLYEDIWQKGDAE